MNGSPPSLFLEGFLLGIALFSAPGPKDTLVIRQGVSGGAVWGVAAICVVADAILIVIGTAGVGRLLSDHPRMVSILLLAGAGYLVWFGGQRIWACIRNESMPDMNSKANTRYSPLRKAAALSFANPYAWLDTVVLIGSIAATKPNGQRSSFLIGTIVASCLWFMLLASGSRKLSGLFKHPSAWRWLDAAIALLMGYLTVGLIADSARLF
ncbi:LysE/ArgO family amino acid transporter [Paraburkholderia oxyphila]|uniref:LysE/ArgO family amino acid transporter n=1 Tax=Paraburkholderia oxyphila TaxID=614212 RepID=UPI00048253EE|nr:LysE family transporter [Paraburkholderia oxyphila]